MELKSKIRYLFLIGLISPLTLFSQSTELSFQLSGGLFQFGGKSASSSTAIRMDNGAEAVSPFSNSNHAILEFNAQIQRNFYNNMLYAIQAGVQGFNNKISISSVENSSQGVMPGSNISSSFHQATLASLGGYRYLYHRFTLDFMFGLEVAMPIGTSEKGDVTLTNNQTVSIHAERDHKTDYRLKAQASTFSGRYGVVVSYSYGVRNLILNETTSQSFVNSRILRVGFSWRVLVGRKAQSCFYIGRR